MKPLLSKAPGGGRGHASTGLTRTAKQAVGEHGANVILDAVGGQYAEALLCAIAWQGRHLFFGFPAGIPKFPLNLVLRKGCELVGVFWASGCCATRQHSAPACRTFLVCTQRERSSRAPRSASRGDKARMRCRWSRSARPSARSS